MESRIIRNLISIIVPCRNGAKTVGRLIDRLQTLKVPAGWHYEIVVGYQQSRDNTLEILKAKGVKIVHSEDFGTGPARNAAVKESRGALLYFVDADACPVGDDFLIHLVRTATTLRTFGTLGGPIVLDPEQKWNPIAVADHHACWFNWTAARKSERTNRFQPGVSLAMSREVFDAMNGFDPKFRLMQDFEIQYRIQRLGLPTYFCADLPVVHHARGTLLGSWVHSWRWGIPYRETYLKRRQANQWWFINAPRWFWLNWPRIFLRRVRLVLRQSWKVSKWEMIYCFLFLLATILVWSVAAVVGKGQPSGKTGSP